MTQLLVLAGAALAAYYMRPERVNDGLTKSTVILGDYPYRICVDKDAYKRFDSQISHQLIKLEYDNRHIIRVLSQQKRDR